MKQVVIENPILNSPFEEPTRHFQFSDEGITDEIVNERRVSSYFIPIAPPKKQKSKQMEFVETQWTKSRIEENRFINQIRERVAIWRKGQYQGITKTTEQLLEYWRNPERDRKLFFCQIEALETAIYITEVARRYGDAWIENELRRFNEGANPGIFRLAFKMATGSGKTVVMAMLIAWHTLNKLADSRNARFSDTFLIVTPGITIRDRLRVLLPNDPQNYYRKFDILPPELIKRVGEAKILITNFHAFIQRESVSTGRLTKSILANNAASPFTETPDQMVRRVCRELGNKKNIIVINDEAHHCYRHKPEDDGEKLKGDERVEAERREGKARVWISGLEAVKSKIGIKAIYDLSATPFFLRGSGYPEGTLFPWVVSDFSLIDAIECGIVKVPRVPVADDSMIGEQPTYRDLWLRIRDGLPKKGRRRKADAVSGEPQLPAALQGALHSLYSNYEKYYQQWEVSCCFDNHSESFVKTTKKENIEARSNGLTPPVMIVVCNNTNVSKMVYDYIAGWDKELSDGSSIAVPGQLPIFNNEEHGRWRARPNTILIDSEQLESGDAMSAAFKKVAASEIEQLKADSRTRFPGRDIDKITDEDLLREVMNTVGKPGKLGEQVKCVVSVSMLTEGWDANSVTHILGVRAFGTQLLCEQVVGRGLRRTSYATNEQDRLEPEYAEVYGVPFSFIPCSGSQSDPKPGPIPTRVRALEERIDCEITFPRLVGYRYDFSEKELTYNFTADSKLTLSTQDIPTWTENAPIVGESSILTLDDIKRRREQEVAFLLAKLVLEKYFRLDGTEQTEHAKEHRFDSEVQVWLFPQVLHITKRWLSDCVICKDNTFPQMLLLIEFAHDAADRIYRAIVASEAGEKKLKPILHPYDTLGSTRYVDFDTTRDVYHTDPTKCHISHVALDSDWEAKMVQTLEEMNEVVCYTKNQGLGFTIPYTMENRERKYFPDFIVRMNGNGAGALNLICEVSGERRKDKAAKVATAHNLWAPAVNNHGGFGQWDFLEISDPWDAKNTISIEFEDLIDFYRHEQNWTNRMILGDSLLVMTSLAEKEGLKGQVQTIYIDPPYGIKFGSNWQVSTRKRDVKDTKAEDITRQPEQIKAYRDTWELGIHSYLTYLRDRFAVAQELLTESGSIFVQIGDENVHLVRCLLDEVFGSENFCQIIPFRKKLMPLGATLLEGMCDYMLWYAKNVSQVKFRQLYKKSIPSYTSRWTGVELPNGERKKLSKDMANNLASLPKGSLVYRLVSQRAPSFSESSVYEFEFQGMVFSPPAGGCWVTTKDKMSTLAKANRLESEGGNLSYVYYHEDFPLSKLNNLWDDTSPVQNKEYVVQTSTGVIDRCLLMTTDTGDLVLDPTCGSGTTAYVAEQWGRRWITIDTSRVALALARTRLMAAKYPYYLLADSLDGIQKESGITGQIPPTVSPAKRQASVPSPLPKTDNDIKKGFVYKPVPHITLRSIANNPNIDTIHAKWQEKLEPIRAQLNQLLRQSWEEWEIPREAEETWSKEIQQLHEEWWRLRQERQKEIDDAITRNSDQEILYDQPYEDNKKIRVTGPFTVESLSPHRVLSTDAERPTSETEAQEEATVGQFETMMLENLRKAGVQNTVKNERLKFDRLETYAGTYLHAEGEYSENGTNKRAAICIGPEHGTVGPELIKDAAKEAVQGIGFDLLIVCGFAFDPHVSEETTRYGRLTVLPARMNPDLAMGDELLKKTGAGNLFMVFGEPDIDVNKQPDLSACNAQAGGNLVVELKGVDVYDPTTGQIRSSSTDDIACWFIDTDYNEESFFVRHAYFCGSDKPYERLKRALRAEIDETAWSALYSTKSYPFPQPTTGKIAVKVINHYGDEVLKVYKV